MGLAGGGPRFAMLEAGYASGRAGTTPASPGVSYGLIRVSHFWVSTNSMATLVFHLFSCSFIRVLYFLGVHK